MSTALQRIEPGTALVRRGRKRPRRNVNLARARWIERTKREWPPTLQRVGQFAQMSLLNMNQRAANVPAIRESLERDVAVFEASYRFHEWIGRHRLALPKPDAV